MASDQTSSLRRALVTAVVLLLVVAASAPARSQDAPATDPAPQESVPVQEGDPQGKDTAVEERLPLGIDVQADAFSVAENGDAVFEGAVTVIWKDTRFQADRMVFRERRYAEAEGSVLMVWGPNRISGTRMVYDLEEDRGYMENAIGEMDPDFQFTAKRAEKIGPETVRVKGALVTTCTQPVPYWSFRVSSATIRMGGYARLWNIRLKVSKVPIFYLPFLLWPAKKARSPGLMLPDISNQSRQGRGITLPLFIPIGDSADVTVAGTWFEKAGFGLGVEARVIPNQKGSAAFSGFWIQDKVSQAAGQDPNRYSINYRQTQDFRNGFRMIADVNTVSDFNFNNDYARDLAITSLPYNLARLEFTRNGRWAGMNVRQQRREQLFTNGTTLAQQSLPEIELRGRSQRLGKTPLYLAFESSAANIQQRGFQALNPIDADYLRFDVFPTLSIPLSPVRWLDFTPRLSYRWTWWSQSAETEGVLRTVVDEPITRNLGGLGFDLVGPKLYKVFATKGGDGKGKYKNTFEPVISYTYSEGFDGLDRVLVYDEVDPFGRAGNSMSYALRTRLYTRRARATPGLPGGGEAIIMPDGQVSGPPTGEVPFGEGLLPEDLADAPPPAEDAPMEPVEIATLEIRQTRSFSDILSSADLDGDGTNEETSRSSAVSLSGRYNPTAKVSVQLESRYHILYRDIESVNLSGNWNQSYALLGASLVRTNGLRPGQLDRTQLNFNTTFRMWRDKIQLVLRGTWDWDPLPGQPTLPQRQWSVSYSTQCCTFFLERLNRSFLAPNTERNDYYFRIDLRGVGKILDHTF
jgi:hypothetical protein